MGGVAIALVACGLGGWRAVAAPPVLDAHPVKPLRWATVSVELPPSDAGFPPGNGAQVATSNCLICHSAGMVLRQPALKRDEWRAEIMTMRSAYSAPVPDDPVETLVDYFSSLVKLP